MPDFQALLQRQAATLATLRDRQVDIERATATGLATAISKAQHRFDIAGAEYQVAKDAVMASACAARLEVV